MVVRFTPAAQQDLSKIWDYTEATWGSMQAETYTEQIFHMCKRLADPVSGALPADEIRPGYQKMLCGKHYIFFKTVWEDREVVRILHQSMDIEI